MLVKIADWGCRICLASTFIAAGFNSLWGAFLCEGTAVGCIYCMVKFGQRNGV